MNFPETGRDAAVLLASASPRRRALLAGAGVAALVRATDVPEEPRPGERPAEFARRAACDKARAGLAARGEGEPAAVLASDTVVAVGDRILGKPASPAEAAEMLRLLSGRTHEVLTAVAVGAARAGGLCPLDCEVGVTRVSFRPLTEADIDAYVATGEPMDKAGAYGIQGGAGVFVEAVDGDYDTVVGLPLAVALELLIRGGHLPPRSPLACRLAGLRGRIAAAADAVGRPADAVTLVAVSKTQPAAAVREALAAGQRDFGENYVQEWRDKAAALGAFEPGEPDPSPAVPRWHFIGHLQSNKARFLTEGVAAVHTLDTASAAAALAKAARQAGRTLEVLLQVNVGREPQKSGVDEGALAELLAVVRGLPGLRPMGLMTVPPVGPLWATRAQFDRLRAVRDAHATPDAPLPWLSMGMSGDFDQAIACGATHVRVGTALFGGRPPARGRANVPAHTEDPDE